MKRIRFAPFVVAALLAPPAMADSSAVDLANCLSSGPSTPIGVKPATTIEYLKWGAQTLARPSIGTQRELFHVYDLSRISQAELKRVIQKEDIAQFAILPASLRGGSSRDAVRVRAIPNVLVEMLTGPRAGACARLSSGTSLALPVEVPELKQAYSKSVISFPLP